MDFHWIILNIASLEWGGVYCVNPDFALIAR